MTKDPGSLSQGFFMSELDWQYYFAAAIATTPTDRHPAFCKANAQDSKVAPVVITSSTSNTFLFLITSLSTTENM